MKKCVREGDKLCPSFFSKVVITLSQTLEAVECNTFKHQMPVTPECASTLCSTNFWSVHLKPENIFRQVHIS